jgi:hypothetical protein
MSNNLQHTDKCCWWDTEEYCDCGAVESDRLGKLLTAERAKNARLQSALEDIIKERGEEYGDSDYQCLWAAIERAKTAITEGP